MQVIDMYDIPSDMDDVFYKYISECEMSNHSFKVMHPEDMMSEGTDDHKKIAQWIMKQPNYDSTKNIILLVRW